MSSGLPHHLTRLPKCVLISVPYLLCTMSCNFHQIPDGHLGVLCKQLYLHITECCVHERVSRTKIATHSFHHSLDSAKLHHLEDNHHWQLDNVFALHLVRDRSSNAKCSPQHLCPDSPSPTPKVLECSHFQDLRNRHFQDLVFHLFLVSARCFIPCFMSFDQTPAVRCSRRSTGTISSSTEMSLKRMAVAGTAAAVLAAVVAIAVAALLRLPRCPDFRRLPWWLLATLCVYL